MSFLVPCPKGLFVWVNPLNPKLTGLTGLMVMYREFVTQFSIIILLVSCYIRGDQIGLK